MSDLVEKPEDRLSRDTAHIMSTHLSHFLLLLMKSMSQQHVYKRIVKCGVFSFLASPHLKRIQWYNGSELVINGLKVSDPYYFIKILGENQE